VAKVLLPFALHGLARQVDGAVGTLLHTTLDLPDFVAQASVSRIPCGPCSRSCSGPWWERRSGPSSPVRRARSSRLHLAAALEAEAQGFGPLGLRPILTGLALRFARHASHVSYGFTLPVALTQDWSLAQDAAVVAALVAARAPAVRVPAPGAGGVFFITFLAYALLSPPWAREWQGHPGNEPKTLRMAVALGHGLTLDVEGVTGPMEGLETRPLLPAARDAVATVVSEAARMESAMLHGGYGAVGASAVRATRVTRQTVRGKEGGIYYVLAPGRRSSWLRPCASIAR
jgi:hypothetical protein